MLYNIWTFAIGFVNFADTMKIVLFQVHGTLPVVACVEHGIVEV